MTKNFLMTTIAVLAMTAGAANAATLSLVGATTTYAIDDFAGSTTKNNIEVGGVQIAPDGTVLDIIIGDVKDGTNGLSLTGGPARVTYTYLGKEAGNSNYAADIGGIFFDTDTTAKGTTFETTASVDGLLDFAFGTSAPAGSTGTFLNNGVATATGGGSLYDFAIAYIKISDTSFYALFDDIKEGDRDFDDLAMRIDVAPIPLPAGGLLLVSGLAGAAALRRRKKA